MIDRLVRRLAPVAMLALVASTAGCYDEKVTLEVHPNGSGKVTISRRFTEQFTKQNFEGKTDAEKEQSARNGVYSCLKGCEGFVAWTDVVGKIDGGRLVQSGVGYFEDVTKLKVSDVMGGAPKAVPFTWTKNADGGFTLAWAGLDVVEDTTFDREQTEDEVKQTKLSIEMMKGFAMSRTVVMPGAVAKATNDATIEGSSASVATTYKEVVDSTALADSYRPRVAKKEITKEAALTEVKAKTKKVSLAVEVTCKPPAADDSATFKKELEKAKAGYVGSDLEKKIKNGG